MILHYDDSQLEAYRIAVENMADIHAKTSYATAGQQQGNIIIGNFFRTAQQCVKLFVKSIIAGTFEDDYLLTHLQNFLESGKTLVLVSEAGMDEEARVLQLIFQYADKKDQVKVFQLRGPVQNPVDFEFFSLADGRMVKVDSRDEGTSVFSFNNPDIAAVYDARLARLLLTAVPKFKPELAHG